MSCRRILSLGTAFSIVLVAAGGLPALAEELPGEGVVVKPVFQALLEERFQEYIVLIGLERLGYEIEEPLIVSIPAAHLSVAQGDRTLYVTHWNPLHRQFLEGAGAEQIWQAGVDSGTYTVTGAMQGYLIDKKTADDYGITNLEQFKDPEIASLFDINNDGRADLTGCKPGWGCEAMVDHHLSAYELEDVIEHHKGDYFIQMADTIARYRQGEPIFYYTWTPLWLSGELVPGEDVEWLEVPFTSLPDQDGEVDTLLPDGRNLGFEVNEINIVANREFVESNPAAKRFMELVQIPINDISAENLLIQQGEDSLEEIRAHAEQWIEANAETFDGWLAEARAAAAE
ncbi:MAG TPA: glycine betaine/L-proline ABC transporter substrate-binding protein ProX [Kiloniellales bacterium]|nr:glycine betaine/L-proline ABC transporter substrate-binding protein ProX [Kiloniellales bacterium]